MKKTIILAFLLVGFSFPGVSLAHPGRTDAYGCHTCRTNCASWGLSTGEYHCHQAKALAQPIEPVRSIRAESVTVPAPEYTQPKTVAPVVTRPILPTVKKVIATTTPKVRDIVSTSTSEAKTFIKPEARTRSWFGWFTNIFK